MQRYVSLLLLAYCTSDSPEPSLLTQCGTLTSDATLVSLFRSNAAPLPCPIKGPLEFTYSQGEGECNSPQSRAEACTQDSRLLLRYQACANVHSSESVGQYSPRIIIPCWHMTNTFYTDGSDVSYHARPNTAYLIFRHFFLFFYHKENAQIRDSSILTSWRNIIAIQIIIDWVMKFEMKSYNWARFGDNVCILFYVLSSATQIWRLYKFDYSISRFLPGFFDTVYNKWVPYNRYCT